MGAASPAGAQPTTSRMFLVVTIAASLVAWDIGFDFGAFETVAYRRIFAVFVVSTVVLIATFVADDETFVTSRASRVILGLPLAYLLADVVFLTENDLVTVILALAVLATFPYTLWAIARILGTDYFTLPRKHQLAAAATVLCIAGAGWYVGNQNDRFLTCDDFERSGDFQPDNCLR